MIILGLTGSIGMGKTTVANFFRFLKIKVFGADLSVHKLMMPEGKAFNEILEIFPSVAKFGSIDRIALSEIVFKDKQKLQKLENILHPLVREMECDFLSISARHREQVVVLDIPLLFETGGNMRCDGTIVATAPEKIQINRILKRPGMTTEKIKAIIDCQIQNKEKCKMADFVVKTNMGRAYCFRSIIEIIKRTKSWHAQSWSKFNYKKFEDK